jgi:hypothetical protein
MQGRLRESGCEVTSSEGDDVEDRGAFDVRSLLSQSNPIMTVCLISIEAAIFLCTQKKLKCRMN